MPFRHDGTIPPWWRIRWYWEMGVLVMVVLLAASEGQAIFGLRALIITHMQSVNAADLRRDRRIADVRHDLAYLKGRQNAFNTAQIHLLDAVNAALRTTDGKNTKRLARTEHLANQAAATAARLHSQVRELQEQTTRIENRLHDLRSDRGRK